MLPPLVKMVHKIILHGKVQGVFYRKSAKIEADRLGVFGWVRNKDDGTVEVLAAGDKNSLEKFINWCKVGSPFAEVKKIEIEEIKTSQEFDKFEII